MTNLIIETDLGQVLNEINQKLDRFSDDVNELKIGQARANEKLDFNTILKMLRRLKIHSSKLRKNKKY